MRSIYAQARTLCVLVFLCVSGQAQSPCPETFNYQDDGEQMHGVINIQPNGPVSHVQLKANFTIAARLPTNYFGSLEPLHLNSLERRLARGEPIKYKVNFPVTSPLPMLTSVTANGKLLCYGPGDVPGHNQVVTTINLEHILTLNSGLNSRPFLTDFIVPEATLEPSYSPDVTKVNVVYEDNTFEEMAWTTRRSRPRPEVQILEMDLSQPVLPTIEATSPRPVVTPNRGFAVTQTQEIIPKEPVETKPVECGVPGSGSRPLILLGDEYFRGEWPWMVAIFKINMRQLSFICSGSLISEHHVVTAAHCMFVREIVTKTKDVVIKVGAFDLDDLSDDISKTVYIDKATRHEGFDPYTLKNDILIMTLQKKVVYNDYIRPVCLWSEDNTDLDQIVNKRGIVTGWGTNEHNEPGRGKPRKARIPIVSTETCRSSNEDFNKLTSDFTFCAGDRNGTGPCNGDSGGGLYMREKGEKQWRLRGIVSVSLHSDDGEYSCNVQQYIVFTDVAKYLSWIKRIVSM